MFRKNSRINLDLILFSTYIFLLQGCASAPVVTPVSVGQVFENPGKKFSVAAPEDNYLYAEINHGVIFSPVGGSDWRGSDNPRGDYYVQVFSKEIIPADLWGNLKQATKWVNDKFMNAQAKKKMIILKEEIKNFSGRDAFYVESFLPEVLREGPANVTVIVRAAFQYANMTFFHGNDLYYLSYADAVNGTYNYKTKLTPHVDSRAGDRLKRFSEGFKLL